MHIETLAVHAGSPVDPKTGAVTPPIHLSTTFERAPDGSFPGGFIYSRSGNPNRQSLEACLAQLEGGAAAAAFSSGQAATFAILHSLGPGDHVIAPEDAYYGTADLLLDHFSGWGLETTLVDMTDLAALVDIARRASARVACDNTWATPMLQHPLQLGADLVMHATTKYLGGHSDILGGAVVAREDDEFFARIRQVQSTAGAVPSPFESWLVMRGIRTLPYRMRAHSANALAIARYLAAHPRIEQVYYPGLETDPGYAVASRQMSLPGGMLSFLLRGAGREETMAMSVRLQIFTRATSLGGPESLIEHRASIEGPRTRAPEGLLRVSVGLEHPDDLIADLGDALGA